MKKSARQNEEDVRVIVRCRPMSRSEVEMGCTCVVDVKADHGCVEIMAPTSRADKKTFAFDAAYGCDSTQEELYECSVQPVVSAVLEGFNGTVFAYGQTGSGKTYTMEGQAGCEGVIPRSFQQVFDYIANSRDTRYLVHASFLEIYQDEVRDLLDPDRGRRLELREQPGVGVHVKDISSHLCKRRGDLERVLAAGVFSRSIGATDMNERSSRSHAVLMVTVEADDDGQRRGVRVGRLNLVDLAGSERQAKSGAAGQRLREASRINLSLSALVNVISALVEGRRHVPYRDSKLTRLLQDSLGGNSKTLMIANIGPASYNYDESLTTLRYASRAKRIRNKPVVNEDPKNALLRVYQQEIERLKKVLAEKRLQEVMRGPPQMITGSRGKALSRTGSSTSQASLERRQLLMEEVERNKQLVARERKEVEELKDQIAVMESTLLYGSKSIAELSDEQQAALEHSRQEMARRKERENSMRQRLRLRQEIRHTYSTLQQQAEAKSQELEALRGRVDAIKLETRRMTDEMDALLAELDDEQKAVVKDLKKKFLIMEKFIHIDDLNALAKRAFYDENDRCWQLKPLFYPNDHVMKRNSRRISGCDGRLNESRRFFRDIIELDLA